MTTWVCVCVELRQEGGGGATVAAAVRLQPGLAPIR